MLSKLKKYYREAYAMGHYPGVLDSISGGRRKLIYYGYLGDGNLGDEMVFWAAREVFKDFDLIPIKRLMPLEYLKFKSDPSRVVGVVLGGGTLFNALPALLLTPFADAGLPFFVHGTGVKEGYERGGWEFLQKVDLFGGVRGKRSEEKLVGTLDLPIIGDAALALRTRFRTDNFASGRKRVILNFGQHYMSELPEGFVDVCVEFITSNKEYDFTFVPFFDTDFQLGNLLKKRAPQLEVVPIPRTCEELSAILVRGILCIGQRLHFVVAAAMCERPCVSISYEDKHLDFLESVGLTDCSISLNEVTVQTMSGLLERPPEPDFPRVRDRISRFLDSQEKMAADFIEATKSRTAPVSS